jgi:acyl-CoA dehydrogenase
MATFAQRVRDAVGAARTATSHLLDVGSTDPRTLLGASAPYLRLLGTTVCAGLLAKGAVAAADRSDEFGAAKVVSARFFGEQVLPAAAGLLPAVLADSSDLYALDAGQL